MSDDPFQTVAIAYSQPQARVMLSLFEWHGIPAYAMNIETTRINTPWTLALGGIPIRVARESFEEARGLLAEVADRPEEASPPKPSEAPLRRGLMFFVGLFTGAVPPPRLGATMVGDAER